MSLPSSSHRSKLLSSAAAASHSPSPSAFASSSKFAAGQEVGNEFACHCGKKFNRVENLVRHEKSHRTTRPFPCTFCPKAFTRSDLLKRHLLTLHAERGEGDGVGKGDGERKGEDEQGGNQERKKRRKVEEISSDVGAPLNEIQVEQKRDLPFSNASQAEASYEQSTQTTKPLYPPNAAPTFDPVTSKEIHPDQSLHELANAATERLPNFSGQGVDLPAMGAETSATHPPQGGQHAFQQQLAQYSAADYQQHVWTAIGQDPSPQEVFNNVDGWGYGMEWLLEDPSSLFDICQPHGIPGAVPPISTSTAPSVGTSIEDPTTFIQNTDGSLDMGFVNTLLSQVRSMGYGATSGNGTAADAWGHPKRQVPTSESRTIRDLVPPSRAATPPIEPSDDDKWPTNWKASDKTPAVGAASRLTELYSAEEIDGDLAAKWSRFWLDEKIYDKVKTSLTLARLAPGIDLTDFTMPRSIHTVNHFISLYFEKFDPQMPIIHLPTFKIAETSPILIAGLICVGSTFSRLKGAKSFCTELVEVIRKTLNALFENESSNLRSVSLIHVYLLQCVAGLWSGNKRTFELVEAGRGALVNLCRRADLLNSTPMLRQSRSIHFKDLEDRWKRWAAAESRKRLGVCICLVDAAFPSLLDTPSYISQGEMLNLVLPCDDRYWAAGSAQQWNQSLGLAPIPPSPFFASAIAAILTPNYVPEMEKPAPIEYLSPFASLIIVSALHHHIYEFRAQLGVYLSIGLTVPHYSQTRMSIEIGPGFEGRRIWLYDALEQWKQYYYNHSSESEILQGGRAHYHLGHIALAVSIRMLYVAAGKFGPEQVETSIPELRLWATTLEAIQAASHSLSLLEILLSPRAASLHYLPGCAFVAVLCLWAYTKHQPEMEQAISHRLGALLRGSSGRVDMPITPRRILEWGAKFLASGQGWRFGAALALVLVKQIEVDASEAGLSRDYSQ